MVTILCQALGQGRSWGAHIKVGEVVVDRVENERRLVQLDGQVGGESVRGLVSRLGGELDGLCASNSSLSVILD